MGEGFILPGPVREAPALSPTQERELGCGEAGDIREELAALAHAQWSGWMEYLFSKCEVLPSRTVVIPEWAVERWKRQATTPYADLPPEERESDRQEADRVLAVFEGHQCCIAFEIREAADEAGDGE